MWKQSFALSAVGTFVFLTMSVDARQIPATIPDFASQAAPASVLCEEDTAELRTGDWLGAERAQDLLQQYVLVSDPAWTCRHPDVASAAGYETPGHRCYKLREIGTGEVDVPLACTERFDGDPKLGAGVASLRCTGWNYRVAAMVEGGFHLTLAAPQEDMTRTSVGSCRAL